MLFEMPEVKFPERSYRELRVAGTGSEPPLGLSTSHGNPEMTPAKCACEVGFSVSSLAEGLRPSKLPKIPFCRLSYLLSIRRPAPRYINQSPAVGIASMKRERMQPSGPVLPPLKRAFPRGTAEKRWPVTFSPLSAAP